MYYVSKISSKGARDIVDKANEIMSLYFSNSHENKVRSFFLTSSFFELLNSYLLNKSNYDKYEKLKEDFFAKFGENGHVVFTEYSLAYFRLKNIRKEDVRDFHINHNVNTINFLLYSFSMIDRGLEIIGNVNKNFLDSPPYFVRANEPSGGRIRAFYRNAYRVDLYSRKIVSPFDGKPYYDMYTPLVLTRMAIEQFAKWLYESRFGADNGLGLSDTIKTLENKKVINKVLSNELLSVVKRGNVNAHDSYANHPFAIIHGIEILKVCFNLFNGVKI